PTRTWNILGPRPVSRKWTCRTWKTRWSSSRSSARPAGAKTTRRTKRRKRTMPEIDRWLRPMIERKGSDLHLRAGSPPMWRLHGHLGPIGKEPVLEQERLTKIMRELVSDCWVTAQTKSELGGVLTELKKYDEAEPMLLGAYQTLAHSSSAP